MVHVNITLKRLKLNKSGGIVMDKNVCDNTLVFGSCYSRSCIEMPSLKEGKAKWKAFYDKFP